MSVFLAIPKVANYCVGGQGGEARQGVPPRWHTLISAKRHQSIASLNNISLLL